MRSVIGHTIFFTSEKIVSVFPPFGAASQSGNVHNFRCFPESIMVSRFADIVSVAQFIKDQENENTKTKTQQNVALLKEFLTLKNESRLMEGMHTSANLSLRYEKKTTTKTMNPAPYVL